MRVLILGNGGREHAMARALRSAPQVELFCAPGDKNPGLATLCTALPLDPNDARAVAEAVRAQEISLVVPGPEAPLTSGVADALADAGILCCGPSRDAAQLEASKAFTRLLTAPLGVPGPRFAVVGRRDELPQALKQAATFGDRPPVVKADGLASGKGVFLPDSIAECTAIAERLLEGELGPAGTTLLLEERLEGEEASLFYGCHGVHAVPLPHARDHKRLLDGDRGPNTGGMGAISPSPRITPVLEEEVRQKIVLPTLRALAARGTPFCGFLFVGLMLTAAGPALLEFNVRLGDPEAQAILPRLADGEFLRLCTAIAKGELSDFALAASADATCAVVLCARGYPGAVQLGDEITVDEAQVAAQGAWIVYAGARRDGNRLLTAGGRVLAVCARGQDPTKARERAYAAASAVRFSGMQLRQDIGWRSA